jgi:uncharacterized integral membrane protein (TIGR00698 family)
MAMATTTLPAHRSSAAAPAPSRPARARALVPGVAAAAGVGIAATVIGGRVPLAGSAVPGAVLGALIAVAFKPGKRYAAGLKFASSRLLQCSVALLGASLSAGEAARAGVASLPVMAGTLAACLGAAWLYGRMLRVTGDVRTLIGVGTGICGASAIAAASPVIEAASADIAYALSTIFVFNLAAVLVFPLAGHALGMSQASFGLFAGTAVNDTSSVVATATAYGPHAASQAVVVKLVRTLMIIPVCAGLAAVTARRKRTAGVASRLPARQLLKLIPWFLIGFLVMAGANSAGLIPGPVHRPVTAVAAFLVAVALSAIGLSTDVAALRRAGLRPLALGALLWVTVAAASLGLQALTGTLR